MKKTRTFEQRLHEIPGEAAELEKDVVIRWNSLAVPHVEAETESDLAFGLGFVHQHLRAGQIALLRRLIAGRLSETMGPPATELDYALRILDIGGAAREIESRMAPDVREWIAAFARGMNHHQRHCRIRPPEFRWLNLEFEEWTARDIIALSRLSGADVTWLAYLSLLSERNSSPDFSATWRRLINSSGLNATSFDPQTNELGQILQELGGSPGSNAFALSGDKTISGSAIVAGDPHLGLQLPNFWLLAGARAPGINVVGLMIPGVPVFGIGRTPHLAWGGTNMRAASSDIVKIEKDDVISSRDIEIRRRLWRTSRRSVRISKFGPVISDSKLMRGRKSEMLALKWVGHSPTDEISALYRAIRARDKDEFRDAFESFGVSSQNFLFADSEQNVGQLMAAWLPKREAFQSDDFVLNSNSMPRDWAEFKKCNSLPAVYKPFRGWVASANNRPAVTDVPITFLFSDDERVQRLNELISAKDKLNREDVAQISRDVFSAKALRLKSGLIGILDAANVELPIRNELLNWDGFYREDSRGALAFELLLGEVVSKLYHRRDRKFSSTKAQWSYVTEYLLNDLQAFEPSLRTSIMREAMARAQKKFVRHQTWGAIHHTRIGYLLSAIPLLGKNFEVARFPSPGSRETAYKSAHGFEHGPHFVKYGSQARYIFDMGGPDDNYVVLLGGQDGLLGSVNFDDQIPLWRSGKYIQLPLSVKDTDENFKWVSVIKAS